MTDTPADTLIVLDFETTGLSPDQGDRAIEIGAVKIENGVIGARFQSLMNPGRRISSFIEGYTGISNRMLQDAPPCEQVMAEFAAFIDGYNLLAHNASFDQKFLDAELERVGASRRHPFCCSMLTARRIYQDAPNHQLGTLVRYKNLPTDGTYHRALADAEMTAHLWLRMLSDIEQRYQLAAPSFAQMQKLAKTAKKSVDGFMLRQRISRPH
ncbi:3'-5' exonuclease [Marinobacterium jannaschii]|uniref:3'-5' exonuclease n=1 Tax=Marinobacterium jannaschii TaxID=64970 RepID=UPI00047F9CC9|nr:3'-5' exonuclease [Marinobacterium jannaschii]